MTRFTIASFNVKNLIGPDKEYYKFQTYTPEEFAWKSAWLADQIVALDADVIGFQEIFEDSALEAVIREAETLGEEANAASQPDRSKGYRKKAIFRNLRYDGYREASLAFAPNLHDTGEPGERRPGLAVLSRHGFVGQPEIIQRLETPLRIPFAQLGGGEAGHYTLDTTSRPILKVRVPVGDHVVSVFNCHLKSKLGEYERPEGADYPPAADLTNYDPFARAMGAARAALRRMGEALVLRQAILKALNAGEPVIVLGDFNDGEHAVSSEIISGEVPFKNYSWMLRHDAKHASDRYTKTENARITEAVEAVRLHSAEKLFVRKSLRDMVYTTAFNGTFESIDQIYLSRHFLPETKGSLGEMAYFSVLNDHLTDGAHPEAPYNKLASDHGQIMAHLRLR